MRGVWRAISGMRSVRWLPTAGLLIAPALVVLLINAVTPIAALTPNEIDVLVYLRHAQDLTHGGLPYRDFAFEYPPLALVSMVVPYVAWPRPGMDPDGYRWLFAAWEGLVLVGLAVVTGLIAGVLTADRPEAARAKAVRAAASRLLLLAIVTAPSLAWRYDVLPALLAGIALLLAIRGRPAGAGVLLGTSILSKVYPLFLIPALGVLWLAPVRVRRLAEFGIGIGVTVAAVMLPLWLLVGDQVWTFVRYQTDRGVQLESLPAGVLLLLNLGGGAPVPLSFGFGSVQVAGAPAAAYAAIQMWLTLFGFAALISLGVSSRGANARGSAPCRPPRSWHSPRRPSCWFSSRGRCSRSSTSSGCCRWLHCCPGGNSG